MPESNVTLRSDTTYFQAHLTKDTSTGPEATSPLDRTLLCRGRGLGQALRRHSHYDYPRDSVPPLEKFSMFPKHKCHDME